MPDSCFRCCEFKASILGLYCPICWRRIQRDYLREWGGATERRFSSFSRYLLKKLNPLKT